LWVLGVRVRGSGEKTLADVPDEDYFDACELSELMGIKRPSRCSTRPRGM